jgi:type VI secretion system secreted protein Hcp
MAIDIFLVIPENPDNPPVEGTAAADQSVAATFPNATVISVSSFELGMENSVSLGSATGGAGAGKVQFDPLIIQKAVDHASPSLFSAASSGRNFQAVQLYLRSSGPAAQPFLAYEFRTVFITKIDWSGNSGSQEAPPRTVRPLIRDVVVCRLRTPLRYVHPNSQMTANTSRAIGQAARRLVRAVHVSPVVDTHDVDGASGLIDPVNDPVGTAPRRVISG